MIIVISPHSFLPDEPQLVNNLLDHGLKLFHFRKYGLSDRLALAYLKNIDPRHYEKLVIHSHHHLASEFGIKRLHINSFDRIKNKHREYGHNYQLSTSTHSIQEFNELKEIWKYAFISPVYQSISKPEHGKTNTVLADMKNRKNQKVNLIGLGGIDQNNMEQVLDSGSDGIALLGSMWNQSNPVNYFSDCKIKLARRKGKLIHE